MHVENEDDLKKILDSEKPDFELKRSSESSFDLRDIESFTFGPFTSRFWMLRKHIMNLNKRDLKKDAAFYAWDCICLSFKYKPDIYLIIKSEEIMS